MGDTKTHAVEIKAPIETMSHNETPRQDEDGRLCQGEDH